MQADTQADALTRGSEGGDAREEGEGNMDMDMKNRVDVGDAGAGGSDVMAAGARR